MMNNMKNTSLKNPVLFYTYSIAALLLMMVNLISSATAQTTLKSERGFVADPSAEKYKLTLGIPPQYFTHNGKRVYPHHVTQYYPFNVRRGKKIHFPVTIKNVGKDVSSPLKIHYSLHMHKGWKVQQEWKTINIGSLKPGERWAKTVTVRYYQSGKKRWKFILDAGDKKSFKEKSGSIDIKINE